ncbi:DMT family transporter [Aliiroseovarius sp. S1123]|uniref:DMT family transporter n=1 Tax=unclassified Aliiroseovarius TaxID=2623558 RepID=UPI001FF491EA|nr:DMT family transporter [Aliiroseovarius sp. S1123]MCK0169599.1 DMT family transporter [Aliiroseovarius sp. S1123]
MATDRPLAAAGFIFAAMFFLGFFDNLVRQIAPELGLWQFHLMRTVMAFGLFALMSLSDRVRLRPIRAWAVMVRGGLAALAMLFYFGGLGFLPVGQVASGLFTAPIWVMLISALFFGKPIGFTRMGAALVGFVGVVIVLDPFSEGIRPAVVVPMAAGFFYALGAIATRQWCEGESALSMLAAFFLCLGVFGAIGTVIMTVWPHEVPSGADGFILRGVVWPSGWALFITFLQAFGSILGVGLLFRGYQLGDPAQVAIYEYSLLGFAAAWSFVLYGDRLGSSAVLGMVLIVVSGVVITLRSRKS